VADYHPRVVAAAVALGLAATALLGLVPLIVALFFAQVVLALAWLSLTRSPNVRVALPALVAAGLAGDLLAPRDGGHGVAASVTVVALGFLVALAGELGRRDRERVVDSLSVTCGGLVLVVLVSGLVATRAQDGGRLAAACALLAVAGACAARALVPRPVSGAVVATAASALAGLPGGGRYVGLAVATGLAAVAAGLAVDAARADSAGHADALAPLGIVVPLAAAGPVAYAASRLLLS
jgi:hypothetical protein